MKSFENKCVLITGASTGIGAALVDALVSQNASVIGVARSADKLNDITERYPKHFTPIVMDVTDENAWKALEKQIPSVPDCVILNAGNCEYLDNGMVDSDLVKRVFEVNFFANIYAGQYLLPAVAKKVKDNSVGEKPTAQWVVVSSSAAFFAMPRGEAYGASKAALNYFYEALQLSYDQVSMVTVNPGFVETPLTDKNDFDMPMKISATQAAKEILNGLQKNKREVNFPRFFTGVLKRLGRLPLGWRTALGKKMVR